MKATSLKGLKVDEGSNKGYQGDDLSWQVKLHKLGSFSNDFLNKFIPRRELREAN